MLEGCLSDNTNSTPPSIPIICKHLTDRYVSTNYCWIGLLYGTQSVQSQHTIAYNISWNIFDNHMTPPCFSNHGASLFSKTYGLYDHGKSIITDKMCLLNVSRTLPAMHRVVQYMSLQDSIITRKNFFIMSWPRLLFQNLKTPLFTQKNKAPFLKKRWRLHILKKR